MKLNNSRTGYVMSNHPLREGVSEVRNPQDGGQCWNSLVQWYRAMEECLSTWHLEFVTECPTLHLEVTNARWRLCLRGTESTLSVYAYRMPGGRIEVVAYLT